MCEPQRGLHLSAQMCISVSGHSWVSEKKSLSSVLYVSWCWVLVQLISCFMLKVYPHMSSFTLHFLSLSFPRPLSVYTCVVFVLSPRSFKSVFSLSSLLVSLCLFCSCGCSSVLCVPTPHFPLYLSLSFFFPLDFSLPPFCCLRWIFGLLGISPSLKLTFCCSTCLPLPWRLGCFMIIMIIFIFENRV